jgi:hypothetical protein
MSAATSSRPFQSKAGRFLVNVAFDSSGEVVGVEIVAPDDETIAIATRFAPDHDLSLVDVLDPRATSL